MGQVTILAPVVRQKKGTYGQLFKDLNAEGFARVRVNGEIRRTDEEIELDRYKKHDIRDRHGQAGPSGGSIAAGGGHRECPQEGRRTRHRLWMRKVMSSFTPAKMACPVCGMAFEELQPRMFSFNSPFGACEACNGLGIRMEFDPDLIIPGQGACASPTGRWRSTGTPSTAGAASTWPPSPSISASISSRQ